MLRGEVPDPPGAVANNDLFLGTAPATFPGFDVETLTELLGVLDSAGIRGRVGIADRITLLIPRRLREHAAELGFARMCRQAVELALAALGLFLHHRDAGAVHLHVQNRNGFADED